jgi:bacillithiol biosynthesis cysteine-adding enzyme BshC
MKNQVISFQETHQFSSLVSDYLLGDSKLKPFYNLPPEIASFDKMFDQRKQFECNRQVLVKALHNQYKNLLSSNTDAGKITSSAIDSLSSENTFTVTTGHQLNIFTGPLYSLYKILTTIKLADSLNEKYEDNKVIPVFWMASEDHDFEEINHLHVFGKKYEWDYPAKGAAGRLSTTGIEQVASELKAVFRDSVEMLEYFEKAYAESNTLAEATRKIMHHLFGSYGLVIIDGDDPELKQLFVPEMERDIYEGTAYHAVMSTSAQLQLNYKVQVQPREINLFYLDNNLRERIVNSENGTFQVLNSDISFSDAELRKALHETPQKFSPNVVMRPLYQEKILPNLAYIGGPGELNYWLQYIQMFEKFNISFPLLMLRNCMMVIDSSTLTKIGKIGLKPTELFKSTDSLLFELIENSTEVPLHTDHVQAGILKLFEELSGNYKQVDPTLVPAIEAEKQKFVKAVQTLEEKARRSLKKKNETIVNQLKSVKEKLFPGNGLQERHENGLPFFQLYGNSFIKELYQHTDPFRKEFLIITDEE